MNDKTFRQKILDAGCEYYNDRCGLKCIQCQHEKMCEDKTDRICIEVSKLADKKTFYIWDGDDFVIFDFQAFIKEQVK